MTKTHTVREWLEQLPEPYRAQALENAEKLPRLQFPPLDEPCDNMRYAIFNSFPWYLSPQGVDYWDEAWDKFEEPPFGEPVTIPVYGLVPPTGKIEVLSNLLDPSEGWTQEGFVWVNTSGDKIKSRSADYEVGISCGEGNKIYIKYFLAPTVLSAMAMVNQYRREQWQ